MMLTDRHMHAVHTMLQKQFSDGEGLQTTLKSQTEFAPLTMVGGYLPTGIILTGIIYISLMCNIIVS